MNVSTFRLLASLAAAALALGVTAAHAVAQQPAGQQPAAKPAAQPAGQPAAKPAAAKPSAPAQGASAAAAAAPAKKERGGAGPLGNLGGAGSKEPIKIDADRLDVFDKEGKAVFKGNVVAVQGETTMRCTTLTVFYERQSQKDAGQAGAPKAQPAAAASPNDSVKHIDCAGPVTVVSKDQIATSDNATFDRVANKVVLTGNAALSQCQNVTRGERIVYDLNTGVANVETTPGGRVKALFVPGSDDKQKQGCDQAPQQAAQPAPPPAAAPAKPAAPQGAAPAPQAAAKPAPKQRAQN